MGGVHGVPGGTVHTTMHTRFHSIVPLTCGNVAHPPSVHGVHGVHDGSGLLEGFPRRQTPIGGRQTSLHSLFQPVRGKDCAHRAHRAHESVSAGQKGFPVCMVVCMVCAW